MNDYFKFETEMSKSFFTTKYLLENETIPEQALDRVLGVVAKYYPEIVGELRVAIARKWVGLAGGIWRSALNQMKNVSAINCTTLDQPEDTLESIAEAQYWWQKFSAYGQGEGIDLSKLRPRGAKLHNTARTSTGAVSFMHTFDALLNVIAQEGRRGASLISLNIKHPDIPEFITVKDEEGVLESANISIQITDDFMKAVDDGSDWEFTFTNKYETISKKTPAIKLFHFIAEHAWKSGDPGLQFIDTAKKYSNSDYLGYPVICTNACSFIGDTLITTKEGIFPIQDLVGKEVTIFDGTNWVKNSTFSITGYDQDLYRVTLQNGAYFDVTEQHRFFTEDGIEKRTYELSIGDKLEYNLEQSKFEGSYHENGAYLKGFLLGDGNIHDEGFSKGPRPQLWLYAPKYCCFNRIKASFNEISKSEVYNNTLIECELNEYKSSGKERASVSGLTSVERETLYKWCHDYKKDLPMEVFNWDNKSKLNLLAGLFDSDGTAFDTKKGFGYQLSSVNKDFLINILRLLSTIGIYGKVASTKKEGISTIKGVAYNTQEVYRITIPQKYAIELAKQVSFARLKDFSKKTISYNQRFRYNKVISIEKLSYKADKVYCTHVDSTSRFMVNSGIITGNSEQWLDPHNVCLLSSINLAKYDEYGAEKYKRLIYLMIHLLDAFRLEEIAEHRSPSPIQHKKLQEIPRIGLGVTGLADFFINNKLAYASDIAINMCTLLFGTLAGESYKASYEIAKRNGESFPAYDKEKYKKSPYIKRLLTEGWIEDFHLDYQAHVCKNTVAPNGTLTEIVEAGGGGIEPLFAKYFVRRERSTSSDWKEWYTYNHAVRRAVQKSELELTKENADKVTQEEWWITAHNVDNLQKLKMMGEIQKYIDSAISVTYNLPESAKVGDIEQIYFQAWKQELKGVAVYREGSKTGVLITDANYDKKNQKERISPKRPKDLECDIYTMQVNKQRVVALVGLYNGSPYEVFITDDPDKELRIKNRSRGIIRKEGSGKYDLILDETCVIEDIGQAFNHEWGALGRMISTQLRHGIPIQFTIEQLNKTKMFGTFMKGVARLLKKYMEVVVERKLVCPECGEEMVNEGGCITCKSCGYSKCD